MINERKEAVKYTVKAAGELCDIYADFSKSMMEMAREMKATKGYILRSERKPWLVRLGLALIAFPEPFVSDFIGTLMVAAGTVQAGLQRRALYVDDVPKALKNLIKDLRVIEENVRNLR
ncbi:MAG: hypothetical protein N3F10_03560 [Candidatus Bathyarchaeota archaeon]|nr:hypothetical protein [Candidatus Bathyarchaeota archaeon]MCX8177357.1 hypothetical protein [Candidatus Bathyarchaeota archaeon]MDW8193803.1 hypothetical protein [Nitrososphaerota archaeon]